MKLSKKMALRLEWRVRELEKDSHAPFDFTSLLERIEKLERQVKRLKGSVPSKRKVRSPS